MNETLLDISRQFWEAMEHADEVGMRACAHPDCNFVHIGITCKLDKEIEFYTSGAFQPTNITFHSQKAELFGDTGVVLTDCDYSLLLGGKETTHHFMVTEVYTQDEKRWKLVTFSFTALCIEPPATNFGKHGLYRYNKQSLFRRIYLWNTQL